MAQVTSEQRQSLTHITKFHSKCRDFTVVPDQVIDRTGDVWCGQPFVLTDKLRTWLLEPFVQHSNLHVLLETVYSGRVVSPLTAEKIIYPHAPCLLTFCILLELNAGDLIHIFRKYNILDNHLPMDLSQLQLKIAQAQNHEKLALHSEELARRFDQAQWKYFPVRFEYGSSKDWEFPRIFPFLRRQLIADKGDTSKVYEVAIPVDFLDEKLSPQSQVKSFNGHKCCHFALKVFRQGYKHLFNDETDAYQVLSGSGNRGMLSYLGDFSCTVKDQVHHTIMLEFADNDLQEYFRRSPPFLPTKILKFWKDMTPVVATLSELHQFEIQRSDQTKAQKYEGWHADIKPDNILLVGDIFKLADPGFAQFQKHQNAHTKNAAKFTGGTTTYGAPERYRKDDTVKDPRSADMWSIGCVLSESATWVVLGRIGVRQFSDIRRRAIAEAIKSPTSLLHRSSQQIQTADFFHDGSKVLEVVTRWHNVLRGLLRPTDHFTHRVLNLVDHYLLQGEPEKRLGAKPAYDLLTQGLIKAEQALLTHPFSAAQGLDAMIEAAMQREAEELQDYTDSQSSDQRQAAKDNRSYLQLPGATNTSILSPSGRLPSLDIPLTSSPSNLSPQISPNQGRWPFNQAETARQTDQGLDHSLNLVRASLSDAREPHDPSRETVFDTFYDPSRKDTSTFRLPASWTGGKKRDERLQKMVTDRDLIFLVDNGQSMLKHWSEATFVLEMLYQKCSKYDEDGVDLFFTCGKVEIQGAKKTTGAKHFKDKMLNCQEARPTLGVDTDMTEKLRKKLKEWLKGYETKRGRQKNLTILVLTDGIWDGNRQDPGAVDDIIVEFDQGLKNVARSLKPSRSVSIQFISFGTNPDALDRLSRLDNDLKYKGVADIVDTEPSSGDIYKMILGSFDPNMDARNDPKQPRYASPPPGSTLSDISSPMSLPQSESPPQAHSRQFSNGSTGYSTRRTTHDDSFDLPALRHTFHG